MEAALTGYEPLEGTRVEVEYPHEFLRVPTFEGTKHKIARFQKIDFRIGDNHNNYTEPEEPVIYKFIEIEKREAL